MPLDDNFGDQIFNARCLGWELVFAWLPHRCHLSKRWIWFKYAYVGTAIYTGPGDDIFEYRWHEKLEHLVWALKR